MWLVFRPGDISLKLHACDLQNATNHGSHDLGKFGSEKKTGNRLTLYVRIVNSMARNAKIHEETCQHSLCLEQHGGK